jgi:hypothetical protein
MKLTYAVLTTLTVAVSFAAPRPAGASTCGEDYEYVAENVSITVTPETTCLVTSVEGSNQPGCNQLALTIRNDCDEAFTFVSVPEAHHCESDDAESCTSLEPGDTLYVTETKESEGPVTLEATLGQAGGNVEVSASFDVVDQGGSGGCSVGSDRTGDAGLLSWVVGALLVGVGRRRSAGRTASR